jgi:LuxR family maltose regulon positive regulatory protein
LSLDSYDSDLTAFMWALIAAVRTAYPAFGQDLLALLQLSELPQPWMIANLLVNLFADLGGELTIVLDDYHMIEAPEVHNLVGRMLQRLPSNVNIAIGTRQEPPLPLDGLRSRGLVREIGIDLLRFTQVEASQLLRNVTRAEPDDRAVLVLLEQTEGWAAGLRLAALALRDQPAGVTPVRTSGAPGSQRMQDFLIEQVYAVQPPDLQQFLLATCIAEQFCTELCQALWDGHAGRPAGFLFEELKTSGLFLIALDDQGIWYRYHHLFREVLLQKLQTPAEPGAIAALHRRAYAWFAAQGLVQEAIDHALAGGDPLEAARLVETRAQAVLNQFDIAQMESWLRRLPAPLIEERPALLLAAASVCVLRSWFEKIPPLLESAALLTERLERLGASTEAHVNRAEAQALWAMYALSCADARRCLEHAQRALNDLPQTYTFSRGMALMRYAQASYALGDTEGALQRLNAARQSAAALAPGFLYSVLLGLASIYRSSGSLPLLERTGRELVALGMESRLANSLAWGHSCLAFTAYVWNQPETARDHCLETLALRNEAHYFAIEEAAVILACSEQALGHPVAARQALQDLLDSAVCAADAVHVATARAAQARLALLQGDVAMALRWVHATEVSGLTGFAHELESPSVTHARVRLYEGGRKDAELVVSDLKALAAGYEARHDVPHLVEVLTLLALAHRSLGNSSHAQAAIECALGLAEPGGFVRAFLDCGEPMRELLQELADRGNATGFIRRLFVEFTQSGTAQRPAHSGSGAPETLLEPLTTRETQILELMAARLSNKEIASELHISWHTVSKHAANLSQKLGVRGRHVAVAQGRALGLI